MEQKELRIDEPLKNEICNRCVHCVQVKRTKKCDQALTQNGKHISCREIRLCNSFVESYKIDEENLR